MPKSEKAIRADEDRKIAAAARVKSLTGSHGSGFMNFIREQGVVGLAVGLAIGTAAGDTVKKLVQLIIGSQAGLQAAKFDVNVAGRQAEFAWGAFVSSLITLLAVALVVYAIVHMLKLDKLDRKKD